MLPEDVVRAFMPLWDDLSPDDRFQNTRPLLAHYTSIECLERILSTNSVWLSNPLLMNDHQEVHAVIVASEQVVFNSADLRNALATSPRF